MIRLILEKIKNKKIMTMCLILGVTLLVAAVSCQPMYKMGSLNRVLRNQFENDIADHNKYPTVISRDETFEIGGAISVDTICQEYTRAGQLMDGYLDFLGRKNTQRILEVDGALRAKKGYPDEGRPILSDKSPSMQVVLACMPELTEHALVYDYADTVQARGCYPCMISRSAMDSQRLYLGDMLRIQDFSDAGGSRLDLIITGIYEDKEDEFFYEDALALKGNVFVSQQDFEEIVRRFRVPAVRAREHYLYDYTNINAQNVGLVRYYVEQIVASIPATETITPLLDSFDVSRKSINVTLWVMELPLLAMILAFIYMVSRQIVGAEVSEIAAYKSRGLSRFQVIVLYLYQSVILGFAGLVIGMPVGLIMCKLAGAATDFLTFEAGSAWMYSFTGEAILYGVVAMLVGIVCVILPVIGMSRVSITQVKSDYSLGKKSFFEKFYLDLILLGLSLYLLYNFRQNIDGIRQDALMGQMMDPFTFVDTCLFLVASGMVFIRLIRMLVNLIYRINISRWKSYVYVAFLQTIRNYNKQILISIFLMLTIAFGIFYSNTARTINSNKIEREAYNTGCDVKVSETWNIVTYRDKDSNNNYRYGEPEYGRYSGLMDEGLVSSMTRVIINDTTVAKYKTKTVDGCQVFGILTKEFGETASLRDGLNDGNHWYTYLNLLAQNPKGVVISKNLAEMLEVKEGDFIYLDRMGEMEQFKEMVKGTLSAEVVGIVDAWPGYERYYYTQEKDALDNLINVEHEHYMAVINYSASVYAYGISPYEVWMKLADQATGDQVLAYLEEAGVIVTNKVDFAAQVDRLKKSLELQIINGMFTLGFVVALIVCIAGFLIYWISFIRQRQLQFGIYRAMGMGTVEIGRMLGVEHLLSTLFSILCGLLGGVLSTILFESLFCIVYLPQKHNLELYMYYDVRDYIRLGLVIALMLIACIVVLRRQVKKLNISDALKLGEE